MFHISTDDPAGLERCLPRVRMVSSIARLTLHYGEKGGQRGGDERDGGDREERARRDHEVREKDGQTVSTRALSMKTWTESYLTFNYEPDLVIKTGGDHLTDFLIWQSVYSSSSSSTSTGRCSGE